MSVLFRFWATQSWQKKKSWNKIIKFIFIYITQHPVWLSYDPFSLKVKVMSIKNKHKESYLQSKKCQWFIQLELMPVG